MKYIAEQFPLPLERPRLLLLPATLPPITIDTSAVTVTSAPQPVTKKHHKYGPSRLGYLDECAGFTSRSGTNAAADEGTFLHEQMEIILQLVKHGGVKTAMEGLRCHAMRVDLTDDEREYLRFCCVRADVYIARKPTDILTEISVTVSSESGVEMNHGTLDVAFIFGSVAVIQDFKFGWVPVKHAKDNLQGMNYALGCFQKYLALQTVGVEFIQPKLGWISMTSYRRMQMAEMYQRCADVIGRAEFVQDHPDKAQPFIKPGTYCTYCALSGSCSVLSNYRAIAASKFNQLPQPPSFQGLSLTKPSDIALARYWVDIIESGIDEIKKRAYEIAELEGGQISCTLPNGEEVIYAISEKNASRSLGSPIEVADVLKEFVTVEEILGASEIAITKLEPIVKTAMVDAAKAAGEKLTKKAAWEQAQSTLEAHGVLSRPDQKIRFLKRKKTVPKELEQEVQQIEEQKD